MTRNRSDRLTYKRALRENVYLSLGSNLGERADYLRRAREMISEHNGIQIQALSSVLENPALLFKEQHDFLNQILCIHTALAPRELLTFCKRIEEVLGRQKRIRYGPREIDVDILSYGDLKSDDPELTLPHPGLRDREYLRILLRELGRTPESLQGSPVESSSRNELT